MVRLLALCTVVLLGACGGNSQPQAPVTPTPDIPTPALEEQAREHCPDENEDPCVESYLGFAEGDDPAALCVNDEDEWFFESPEGRDVGDTCKVDATIVAIIGGD